MKKIIDVSEIEDLIQGAKWHTVFEKYMVNVDDLRTLLGRLPSVSAPTISEGYALVPIEPTEEMIRAGWDVEELVTPYKTWAAMLSASPTTDTITIDRTEYEAMKADAERYRKMRKITADECGKPESDVDQAIDQARKI